MRLVLSLLLGGAALAGELAGVTLPDTVVVDGRSLVLNGLGLREKLWIDVYVGGLYLPEPTRSAEAAIAAEVPKRIVMHFIYAHATRDQLVEAFQEGLDRNPDVASLGPRVQQLYGWFSDMRAGEQVVLDYLPGTGTRVTIRGEVKGTIPGADFMRAVWSLFIGPHPPSEALKRGMLGG